MVDSVGIADCHSGLEELKMSHFPTRLVARFALPGGCVGVGPVA